MEVKHRPTTPNTSQAQEEIPQGISKGPQDGNDGGGKDIEDHAQGTKVEDRKWQDPQNIQDEGAINEYQMGGKWGKREGTYWFLQSESALEASKPRVS